MPRIASLAQQSLSAEFLADGGGNLVSHQIRSSGIEVHGVVVEIPVLDHERVLIVDGDLLGIDEGFRDGIAHVDAFIGRAVKSAGLHRRNSRPDQRIVLGNK
jgi:hypothetical protein